MANSIQINNSMKLSGCDKERQEQSLLFYVRKCAERKKAGSNAKSGREVLAGVCK